MPMRTPAGKVAIAALIVLAGCPTRFDPRADPVKGSPDAAADKAYREARARLDVGDLREASSRFAEFREKYPNDPLAPSATLGEARARLGLNEGQKAKELLESIKVPEDAANDPMRARTAYLLGFALHKTGDFRRARDLLRPFSGQLASGDDAIELHAVLGDCAAHLNDIEDALKEYELFFSGARPAEKLYLRDQAAALVTKLTADDALRIWNNMAKDGLAAAYLGRRVAADRRAAGDENMARVILDQSRNARERIGLEDGKAPARADSERAIGLLLPLTGKGRPLGERALRGALLAADLAGGGGLSSGLPIELKVRDSASDPARALTAIEELEGERVAAVLGPPDRAEAGQVAPRAEALGIPFVQLAPDSVRRGDLVFKMVRPSSATAAALVQRAKKNGARSVAILAPDSVFGRALGQAFKEAAQGAGLKVVADVKFPEGSTTFVDPVKRVMAARPDALLVPAAASQLSLIAPQMSSSGLTAMPGVKPGGKEAKLYATSDGITPQFLQSTAKYLQGAVLGPTFYPDVNEPRVAAFVDRYRAAYGEEPSSLDALAYDAVRAVRIAIDHHGGGNPSRAGVASQMAQLSESGITGDVSFTAMERSGSAPLYVVDGNGLTRLK
jgi:branched-chain amino acid transport system substrate-binding protein